MENRKFIKFLIPVLVLGFFIVQVNNAFAYSVETHAFLTEEVIKFYNQNFSNQQIPDELKNFLLDGSRREDDIPRWMNHFYDPVYNRGLEYDPKTTDLTKPRLVFGTWQKSKDWAQDNSNQNNLTYKVPATIASILTAIQQKSISALTTETDFTWQRAIRFYVNGEEEKAMFLLGHILHLIEDASVPDHTRNDDHPGDSPYEIYTQQFTLSNPDKNLNSRLAGKAPIILLDLNSYFDGLAKYSNNGFYSKDTIGIQSGYEKPEPDFNNTKLINDLYYVINKDQEGNEYYLLAKNSLKTLIVDAKPTITIDENLVKESYRKVLSTKSIQYGAGVINLFLQEVEKAKNDPNFVKTEEKSFFAQVVETVKNFFAGIFGGQSFQPVVEIDSDSVKNDQSGTNQESPANIKECSFDTSQKPSHSKIIINEVAWMGGISSANDEWIELKNISKESVNIASYQLLDRGEQIKIVFDKNTVVPTGGFYLLERNSDETVPSVKADLIYKGALSNTDEGLRLFDANCGLIDDVLANPKWFAGDNVTKKTMERDLTNFSWHTSNIVGGTPKKENSQLVVNKIEPPVIIKTQETEKNLLEETEEDEEIIPQQATSTLLQIETANFKQCSFSTSQSPSRQKIIINEIAWMGTANSANDEWIELKNISSGAVDLTGWQLIDKGEQIKVVFNKNISAGGFYLLERTDDNSVPTVTADFVYTGILSNSDEGLRLFDNNCNLIDEVLANSGSDSKQWPAGDNVTKQTMERKSDLSWQTSVNAGGTPKTANSSGYVSYGGGGGGGTPTNNQQQTTNNSQPAKILINEVQITSGTGKTENDFIELYNPNNFQVNLNGYRLVKRTKTDTSDDSIKSWTTDVYIPANGYYLWANSDYTDIPVTPDITTTATISNDNSVAIRFGAADTGTIIDSVAWGEAQNAFIEGSVFSINFGANQSIQRKFQNNTFIDNENNANDFEIQTCPSPKSPSRSCSAANQAPSAFFVYTPQNPQIGDLITFNAAFSTDADGTISLFQWDFGDNATSFLITATTTHSYSSPGTYSVSLTVFDNQNAPSTATSTVISVNSPQSSNVNHLVISEIMAGIAGNPDNEFIELYNPTNNAVNLSNWSLKRKTSQTATSTENLVLKFNATSTIAEKSFFLIAHRDYSGTSMPDFRYTNNSNPLAYSDDVVILYNSNDEIIDEVSYQKIEEDQSLERKAFYNSQCVLAQDEGEFLGNGCDTDNADDFEIRNSPNPQNSQNFPEPRNVPSTPSEFEIQYSSSTMELVFNWDASQDYSGATSTLTYKINDISNTSSTLAVINTASTTADISIDEVGRDYQFSIQALDKEGLGSESVSSTISVPSFLTNLYFYQDSRSPGNYLIETYYEQYPFVPDLYYTPPDTTWKILVFYLNSEPEKEITEIDSFTYSSWQPNDNLLIVKYPRCSGDNYYNVGSPSHFLILPDVSDKCSVWGGTRNIAMNYPFEDNHFIIRTASSSADIIFTPNDYLTIAYYSFHHSSWWAGAGEYFNLVAVDKTKYYFTQTPTHQPPQLNDQINLNFDRQNSRLKLDWPKATDPDTLDYLLTYEIKYNDSEEWQLLGNATGTSRLVSPGDNFSVSARAKDEFNDYSNILIAPWTRPEMQQIFVSQTVASGWSDIFGQWDGYNSGGINLQSITPEIDSQFNTIVLRIKQNQISDSANLKLSVFLDNGANPPDFSAALASSVISDVYGLDESQDIAFSFINSISLSNSVKYWLMLEVQDYNSGNIYDARRRNSWQNAVADGNIYGRGESAKIRKYYFNGEYSGFNINIDKDWYLKIGMEN